MKTESVDTSAIDGADFSTFFQQIEFIKSQSGFLDQDIVVRLRSGLNKQPLVFVHPIGGTLFSYKPLVSRLTTDRLILGIQESFMSGDFKIYSSVIEQAKYYIHQLVPKLVTKELVLAGHSSGGVVAFEMCNQLQAAGFDVKKLIIFDSWAKMPFDFGFRNQFVNAISRQLDKIKPRLFLANEDEKEVWLDVLWQRMLKLIAYKPCMVSVDTVLFIAEETMVEYAGNELDDHGWGNYVKNLQVYTVPGNHETLLSESNIDSACQLFNKVFL